MCVCYPALCHPLFTAQCSRKTDSSHKPLHSSNKKYIGEDESTGETSLTSSLTKREPLSLRPNESDSNSSSHPISDDSTGQAASGAASPTTAHRKTVAIDMSQNECFTHRLLPAVSPEFDNVMDQVLDEFACMHVCVE